MSKWFNTALSRLLNIRYPIVLGPFGGGSSTPELTASVSNAGGLGSFGSADQSPEKILQTVADIRKLTDKPFAINNWVPVPRDHVTRLSEIEFNRIQKTLQPYFDHLDIQAPSQDQFSWPDFSQQVDAILEAAPPVWSFIFGIPDKDLLDAARKRQIFTIGSATTVEEALALDEAGIDCIVASGSDAGGHRGSFLKPADECFVGTFSLIPQIADAVKKPVIAAGGIATGRSIKAALILGADGVQIGTRFLACNESNANATHKRMLNSAEASNTSLTKAFSGRYARGITNGLMRDLKNKQADIGPFPMQNWLSGYIRREAAKQNKEEFLSLWAGQAAQYAHTQTAQECFNELLTEVNILDSQQQV